MIGTSAAARRTLGGLAILGAVVGSVVGGVGSASAVAVTPGATRAVAGAQGDIGCLSATKCLLVGYNVHGVGDIVPVTSGVPGPAVSVKGSQSIDAIGCVSGAGCVALGRTSNDVGTLLVPIKKSGQVGKAVTVKTAAGMSFSSISCVAATSCEVAGVDILASPMAFVVGSWNGRKLTTHRVAGIKGTNVTDVADLSCAGAACLVVGYVERGSALTGVTLPVKNGKPGTLGRHPTDLLASVACVSATTCYATGSNSASGLVQTLTAGAIVKTTKVASAPQAIACSGQSCTAVGQENPPPTAPAGATFYGAIISLTAGVVGTTASVAAVSSYSGVAMPTAGSFVAVGLSASGKTSAVTTG